MLETLKTVFRNLRNAKFHADIVNDIGVVVRQRDTARMNAARWEQRFNEVTGVHRMHLSALKALTKRFGPSLWLPTRCLNEAQSLTLETKKRDKDSLWIRVKGVGKGTH